MAYIDVENKQYKLKFGINAMIDFEELTGKNFAELGEGMGIKDIRAFFHLAIRNGEENYNGDVKKSGKILDEVLSKRGFDYLVEMMTKTIEESLGKQKVTTDIRKKKHQKAYTK